MGEDLARKHGKHRFYSPDQIRRSSTDLGYPIDWSCWAMALFSSPGEFDSFHIANGEICDYASMKADMVSTLTNGASSGWFLPDLSWLDWPDIDVSGIFDLTP